MKSSRLPLWLLASILVTTLLATYAVVQRSRAEAANNSVAIAAEYDLVESLSASQGLTVEEGIERLRERGLNTLVLSEESVASLASVGKLTFESSVWKDPAAGQQTQLSSLVFVDPSERERVRRGLSIRFQSLASGLASRRDRLNLPPISGNLVRSTAIGLNPDQARVARRHGMAIVGRFGNPDGLSEAGVRQTINWGKELGVSIFLPSGDQVLGRREALSATIEQLKKDDILYATAEFAKIGGDASVVGADPTNVVRLHTAQTAELDKLTFVDAVERYVRAARERNMRVLLLRALSQSGPEPLTEFGDFLGEVSKQVQAEGQLVGAPTLFQSPGLPRFFPMLIALAAMPMVWFAAAQFVANRQVRVVGAALLALIGVAALTKIGLQASAFIISIGLPVAGFAMLNDLRPKSLITGFAIVSFLSLLGGLCIAGMLNGPSFYAQVDEFRGVKLSVFLPVVIVGAFFFIRLVDWRGTLASPIRWGTAALGMLLLLTLAIVVARSGNDTGAGASDTELLLRSVLDRVLYVRPRTKEFLIGHPFLMLGIGMLGAYWKRHAADPDGDRTKALGAWTTVVLMVGAIGQTSIVNTMSHLHIPVVLSVVRVVTGLVIGALIGGAAWLVAGRGYLERSVNGPAQGGRP